MFGDDKLRFNLLEEKVHNLIREYYTTFERLEKKVNGLYEKDIHDTERPKVDILSDEVWEKIIGLEKKK